MSDCDRRHCSVPKSLTNAAVDLDANAYPLVRKSMRTEGLHNLDKYWFVLIVAKCDCPDLAPHVYHVPVYRLYNYDWEALELVAQDGYSGAPCWAVGLLERRFFEKQPSLHVHREFDRMWKKNLDGFRSWKEFAANSHNAEYVNCEEQGNLRISHWFYVNMWRGNNT